MEDQIITTTTFTATTTQDLPITNLIFVDVDPQNRHNHDYQCSLAMTEGASFSPLLTNLGLLGKLAKYASNQDPLTDLPSTGFQSKVLYLIPRRNLSTGITGTYNATRVNAIQQRMANPNRDFAFLTIQNIIFHYEAVQAIPVLDTQFWILYNANGSKAISMFFPENLRAADKKKHDEAVHANNVRLASLIDWLSN